MQICLLELHTLDSLNLLNATNTNGVFAYIGSNIISDGGTEAEIGDPPNLTNWNLSTGGSMASFMHGCYFNSNPDFSTNTSNSRYSK